MTSQRDWIDYASAFGSIGTLGAFLYLFYQQWLNKVLYERTDFDNTQQQIRNNTQQFENSLFNLIGLHNQIITNLYNIQAGFGNIIPSSYTQGIDTFSDAYWALRNICSDIIIVDYTEEQKQEFGKPYGERYVESTIDAKEVLIKKYHINYYDKFEPILNHYFRNLYHIYKYIDESDLIADPARLRYASIVRAQLSQNELYVLMFNFMIQDYGYPKMMSIDKKYNVLKNFRKTGAELKYFVELYEEIKHKSNSENQLNGLNPNRND